MIMVVTSPPYANRYDYTRTYALELAWMGVEQAGFSALRQKMLSATVENRGKLTELGRQYGENRQTLDKSIQLFEKQEASARSLEVSRRTKERIEQSEHHSADPGLLLGDGTCCR